MVIKKFCGKYMYCVAIIIISLANAPCAFGAPYSWVDWVSATSGSPGSATGTITFFNSSLININYSGELYFAQTGAASDISYWSPSSPYISSTVPNSPPASDIIFLNYASQLNTLTFSSPVTDPVMAILSLGAPQGYNLPGWVPASYTFNAPFDILSSGAGYFSSGVNWPFIKIGNNTIYGEEGTGVIQFHGTFDSISWSSTAENAHGFTVGVAPIPEPSTMLLLSSGLVGLVGYGRRRFKK